ncbi:MAG: DNA mismatch repair protein MutS [Bdellovibrionaceae bacterium]|nr:DNA mismatch repair protein MutS [Pseudobdellovibrionaceae bacterium]
MTDALYIRSQNLMARHARIRTRLNQAQNARLWTAGLFFVTLFIATLQPGLKLEVPAVTVFVILFSYFVVRTQRLRRHATHLTMLAAFYERQSRRSRGLAVDRPAAAALESLSSPVSSPMPPLDQTTERQTNARPPDTVDLTLIQDLNLIGPHSVFTLLDETVSDGGRRELARWIVRPNLNREQILARQRQVQELARERWFFIRLLIAAGTETELELSTQQTLEYLKKPLLEPGFGKWVAGLVLVWLASLIGIIASILAPESLPSPSVFSAVFIAASLYVLNRVGAVFKKGVGLDQHLAALVALFRMIEARPNSRYRELLPETFASRPSAQLKRFHFVLNFLSAEAHPLIYLVLNMLLPWGPVFAWLLERERLRIHDSFPTCLDEFHRLEALISLTFLYHYQTRTFASLQPESTLDFDGLYHPLIPRERVIANHFTFRDGKHLGLITGSNMSGKSTFLRTIGVNQALTNMGAPCFAQRMDTSVFEIASCIQVSDSLRDGFSYFYSEVLRLKRVIEDVHQGRQVLYLIDEIFRGTNNRERQIGSRAVIKNLVASTSLGFVSTHDLELTSLEENLPGVQNLHFREEIHDGEMVFSYLLQPGPCPTTNALVIMEQAGLDVRNA